jgi:energy-coupling factor transport system ATP-binding protein
MPIKVEKAEYSYQRGKLNSQPAINQLSLDINNGEIIGILGGTGAGKTTLLQLLNGLLKPDKGKVIIDNIDTATLKKNTTLIPRVGMVWQFPEQQLFCRTVYEEMAIGLKLLGLDKAQEELRIKEALQKVGLTCHKYQHRRPVSLSSGEKRRLAIACLLSLKPSYLLLDEAFAGLDFPAAIKLADLLQELNRQEGSAIIITGHNLKQLIKICQRIIILHRGQIVIDTPSITLVDYYPDLKRLGITLPVFMELLYRLKSEGWPINTNVDEPEAAVEEVIRSLSNT